MSNEPLEEERDHKKNAEKQTMDAPQEEFVGDQSTPSRDISTYKDVEEGDEVERAKQEHAAQGAVER